MSTVVNAENNERAVTISEEIEFFEELLRHEMPEGAALLILDRRDELRAAMQTAEGGNPTDTAEDGWSAPADLQADEYDPEDAVDVQAQDEDHEFQPDRGGINCLTCGQPEAECQEEP